MAGAYLCRVLKNRPAIQSFFAALLLSLSLLGSLPKTYFHDALANHKDTPVCKHPGKQNACVHVQGYHCAFTDLVVTEPYAPPAALVTLLIPPSYTVFRNALTTVYLSIAACATKGRGPPYPFTFVS